MIDLKWHIVTAVLWLSLVSGGFSQSFDGIHAVHELQAADTIAFPGQPTLDSLHQAAERAHNSLKHNYDSVAGVAGMAMECARNRIDSLNALGLDADRYTKELDSIHAWSASSLDSLTSRLAALQSGVNGKLTQLDLPPQVMEETKLWTSKLDELFDATKRPDIAGKVNLLPDLPDAGMPSSDLKHIEVPDTSLPSLEGLTSGQALPEIPDVNLSTGNIGDLADPLAPVQQLVADVVLAVPADAESVAVMLEEKAASLPATANVTQQLDEASALNPMPGTSENPEAMKEKLIEDGKKMAVNHFAGKEEQLQQAMDKLAVYKKKYNSIESVANLPKKTPNELRDTPIIERLVPGIALQVGRTGHWLLDANLYLGYRFTSRITAGAGWNQRIAYNADAHTFRTEPTIYGPRAHGEYSIGGGFSARLEIEYMNTYVSAPFASNPDNPDSREWVFGTMAGMKKTYTITRRLKGTVVLMYNLFDPHHRSPYRNRLNGRFGVEWRIQSNHNKEKIH